MPRTSACMLTGNGGRLQTHVSLKSAWQRQMDCVGFITRDSDGLVLHGLCTSALCVTLEAGRSEIEADAIQRQSRRIIANNSADLSRKWPPSRAIDRRENDGPA